MTQKTTDKGEAISVYIRKEAREYLEEQSKKETRSVSFIVNRILVDLRKKDLENKANSIGTTGANKTIGSQSDENTNQSPQTIKEGVKNE